MGSTVKLDHQNSSRRILSNQSSNDSVEMQKRSCGLSERSIAILFTLVASLGHVSVGTMVAWSCNAFSKLHDIEMEKRLQLLELEETEELSEHQRRSLTATPALAAAICALVVYKVYHRVGTKMFMLTAATLMIVANFLLTFGNYFWQLSVGRALAGVAAGIITTLVPLYVDEFGSKQYKPLLDSILYVQFGLGILVQLMSDLIPFTQLSSMVSSTFPIFLFIGFLFLPESARYLATSQQINQARAVLKRTHNCHDALTNQLMENSLNHWQQSKNQGGGPIGLWEGLKKFPNTRIVLPTLMLIVFQQLTDAVPMMFYLSRILSLVDGQYTPEWTAITVAAILVGSIPVYRLLNIKIGDYKVLIWSSLVMAASMATLGWHCHVQALRNHPEANTHLPLACFGVFMFMYGIGFQRIPWRWLDAAIEDDANTTVHVRTVANAISWAALYLSVRLLPFLIAFVGVGCLFWNLTVICLFAVAFILVSLPNMDRAMLHSKPLGADGGSGASSSSSSCALERVPDVEETV
ncbi:facilitated trehalose transporter Tret1-like [Uranotaenia lowii]|uniref:facilitated trehalose transporter Tret1-like n=1 Tax=Uranotaenia lowii TaxID=190385 RepID=UPI002478CC2A|nr:facilitated trehalose transporter Tret1-like [Uranotaenia lowii]